MSQASKLKGLSVGEEITQPTETLQVRSVKTEHIEWLLQQQEDKGYSSLGKYINALLDEVRDALEGE